MTDTNKECRCAIRKNFLAEHPIICFFIGCALIGVGEAGCSASNYFDALTKQVKQSQQ